MLVFDLTPDLAASEGHIRSCTRRHPSWIEFRESAPRPSLMPTVFGVWQFCFNWLYAWSFHRFLMDTVQIICTLKDITSFRGAYPSDLLPTSIQSGTIINADPHTREGSHWLAIHFNYPFSSAFYFDSYGRAPSDFHSWNVTAVWRYNTSSLQRPTSVVCGHYCCLFTRAMDKGITPLQFVRLFTAGVADHQVVQFFKAYFRPVCGTPRGGRCCKPSHTL